MIAAYRVLNDWYSYTLLVGKKEMTALEINLLVSCKMEHMFAVT